MIHDSLAAWPWAAEVLTADGFLGRLGEPALRTVETIVAGAIDHGRTAVQAVDLFRGRRQWPALPARDTCPQGLAAFAGRLLAQATPAPP